jgi:hypothetical protein
MKKIITLTSIFLFALASKAQDLMNIADSASSSPKKEFTIATFKDTRLVNLHTIETAGKRTLDFRVSHRFGSFNSGSYNFFGLDGPASIRLGLEYSYDGRLMAGIGRSSVEKMFDGFLKFRLLRQTTNGKMPLSITLFTGMYYTTQKDANEQANGFDKYEISAHRVSYVYQMMLARKFSSNFSLQATPFFVHYNLVDNIEDKNDMYGVAAVTRMKFTKRMAITIEYAYRMNDYSENTFYDSFGVGWEIETGGHVFSIHFTNSFGIVEPQFFGHTDTKWDNAGIRIGFNISRVFTI